MEIVRGSFLGEVFYLQLELFFLAVELLCLQSVEVLLRGTFLLQVKKLNCKQKSSQAQLQAKNV